MPSLNDLWNDSDFTVALFIGMLVLAIAIIIIGYNSAKKQNTHSAKETYIAPINKNNISDKLKEERAKIISKNAGLVNWMTFEMASGSKITFEVEDKELFETVFSGDFVIVKYRGDKLISFRKES